MGNNYYLYEMYVDTVFYNIVLFNKYFDYISKSIFEKKIPYEIEMLRHIVKHLRPGETFVDIGANIGNHSLYVAAQKKCNVISFEPNKLLFSALEQSVIKNRFGNNIETHCVALGDESGKCKYHSEIPKNTGAQSLVIGDGDINLTTLDDLEISDCICSVKIDVEGMELNVLKGASITIKKNFPLLYIECQNQENFFEIHEYLSEMNYFYIKTFNATPTHLFVHNNILLNFVYELQCTLSNYIYKVPKKIRQLNKELQSKKDEAANALKDVSRLMGINTTMSDDIERLKNDIDVLINENLLLNKLTIEKDEQISGLLFSQFGNQAEVE